MGTPDFAVPTLSALIESKYDIGFVITQPDKPKGRGMHIQSPPVKEVALNQGLQVYQPQTLRNNAEIRSLFSTAGLDAVIVVAYGKMIPPGLLSIPKMGFINIHASLLPDLRGASPINRAVMAGYTKTGISIMQIDEGMDSGPIYLQSSITFGEEEDAAIISERLSILGAAKLLEVLALIEKGKIRPVQQDNTRATYAPMLTKDEGKIDWSKDPRAIYNMIRGLVPWPCAYTYFQGKMLKIMSASYEIDNHGMKTGTLLKYKSGVRITCNGGYILPKTLQLEGKKMLDARAFSCGLKTEQEPVGREKEIL
ncbi:MAG TPA: methionyl-tRNA formyltransferase [Desulfomonilia bacterium]|nr:methionyl-tRNA formyltransferase [Desulfomonilia bacterium]